LWRREVMLNLVPARQFLGIGDIRANPHLVQQRRGARVPYHHCFWPFN
jgi:hypothetical protein